MKHIYIRFGIIIIAILTGFCMYSYILRPLMLEPMCLINTNSCLRLGYYKYNNSALMNMGNNGIWLWFNGSDIYIYGQNVGQLCEDPSKYQTAYKIEGSTGIKKGYECVMTLENVLSFYKKKNVPLQYVVKKIDNFNTFNVYDVMNIMQNEKIIVLPKAN